MPWEGPKVRCFGDGLWRARRAMMDRLGWRKEAAGENFDVMPVMPVMPPKNAQDWVKRKVCGECLERVVSFDCFISALLNISANFDSSTSTFRTLGFRISMPLEPLGSHDLALLGNCKGCNMFTAHGHGAAPVKWPNVWICYIYATSLQYVFPLLTIQNHTKKCKMSSFTHVHCAKGGGCGIIVRMTKGVLMRTMVSTNIKLGRTKSRYFV